MATEKTDAVIVGVGAAGGILCGAMYALVGSRHRCVPAAPVTKSPVTKPRVTKSRAGRPRKTPRWLDAVLKPPAKLSLPPRG